MPQPLAEITNRPNHHPNHGVKVVTENTAGHGNGADARRRQKRITSVYKPMYTEVITLSPYGKRKDTNTAGIDDVDDEEVEFVRHIRQDPKANLSAALSQQEKGDDDVGDGKHL